jgi:CheY-like chemotaxis protein
MDGPATELGIASPPVSRDAPTILIAEDDDGHARLMQIYLEEAGVTNPIIRFVDGQEVLDFLLRRASGPHRQSGRSYLLLLDIRMPKIDGVEVLRVMKSTPEIRKIPAIMLTTTDDPHVVDRCYDLGCSLFITKPMGADAFSEAIGRIGGLTRLMTAPRIGEGTTPTEPPP